MIKYNIFGDSTNGDMKQITLSERQIYNLLSIIKGYKEELCGSNQAVNNCKELIDCINNSIKGEDVSEAEIKSTNNSRELAKQIICASADMDYMDYADDVEYTVNALTNDIEKAKQMKLDWILSALKKLTN